MKMHQNAYGDWGGMEIEPEEEKDKKGGKEDREFCLFAFKELPPPMSKQELSYRKQIARQLHKH